MTTVYLARHAATEWSGQKRITGQLDPALAERGIQQSARLAERLRSVHLARICTSTLKRTIQTAEPTARLQRLTIDTLPSLMELHMGVLQGRYRDQRDPGSRRLWDQRANDKWHFRAPGGENFDDLKARVLPCLQRILRENTGGALLIVGHRGTNRVLLGALLGLPESNWPALEIRHDYVYRIDVTHGALLTGLILEDERDGFVAAPPGIKYTVLRPETENLDL